MIFSHGSDIQDARPRQIELANLDALAEFLELNRAADKSTAGYICAGFADRHRGRDSVLPTRVLAIDFDGIDPAVHSDLALWLASKRGIGWATHSSTPQAPRERALLVLDRDVSRDESIAIGMVLQSDVAERFGDAVKVDPSTFRPEQPLFLPPEGAVLRRYLGDPVVVDRYLETAARPPPTPRPAPQPPTAVVYVDGQRTAALMTVAGRLRRQGLPPTAIEAALLETNREQCNPPLPADKVIKMVASVCRYPAGRPVEPRDGASDTEQQRATIVVNGGDRHLVVVNAETHLAERREIYQRGGSLVRVAQAQVLGVGSDEPSGNFTDPARVLMTPADPEWLTTRLTELIAFFRPKGKDGALVPVDAPEWLGRALIAERAWPTVRPLNGVTSAPIVRPDGSVCTDPGYDATTGTLLVASMPFDDVKSDPTQEDAVEALQTLRKPFQHYDFATPAAESTVLSLVLSRLARHLMDTVPLHLFDASKAGTGKTSMVEAASIIVDGVRASLRAWPESEEEMRKSITSCLLASHGTVCFDNVPNGKIIASAVLDKLLTNVVWEDRLLGGNSNVFLHNNLVVAATGNNVRPSQDTVRRVLACRVMAAVEDPWNRSFPWTPLDYAYEHRGELVLAACTILSAFIKAGKPQPAGIAPLGTFEDWSRIVRAALMWLDMPDPVSTQTEFMLADPAREALSELLHALNDAFPGASFRAGDVVNAAHAATDGGDTTMGQLRRALKAVFDNTIPDLRRLGRYFDTHRDEMVDGLRIVSKFDAHSKSNRWRVHLHDAGSAG